MPPIRDLLSAHDREVLDSIFNPLEMTSACDNAAAIAATEEQLRLETAQSEAAEAETAMTPELQKSKELELQAVQLAEEDKLEEALAKFEAALQLTPQRPSIYNNRGQCYRLAKRDDEAFADLCRAIELCPASAAAGPSNQTRCHALCQRGIMQRKRERLDEARSDFEEAANLGSKFARQQLVEINPFAALCNQMLRQAFDQLN